MGTHAPLSPKYRKVLEKITVKSCDQHIQVLKPSSLSQVELFTTMFESDFQLFVFSRLVAKSFASITLPPQWVVF